MAEQLAFDLPVRPAFGRSDFLVAPSNALAVRALDDWQSWPQGRVVLAGSAGSGKTHLARVWQAATGAGFVAARDLSADKLPQLPECGFLVLEDVDRIAGSRMAETALFHLLNLGDAAGAKLLLSAKAPPARLRFRLADLQSRLEGARLISLAAPDDALLGAMLVKQFGDRQIEVSPELVAYLLTRIERSTAAVGRVVVALDRKSLAQKRKITRALAREVLDNPGGFLA